jgi:hypothetical protein
MSVTDRARLDEAAKTTRTLLASGRISASTARRILDALGADLETNNARDEERESIDFISWMSRGVKGMFTALGASLAATVISRDAAPAKARKDQAAATDSVTRPVVGNVDALLSLETITATLKPLFNEYVWWFVAMVLVISGSVLGIREAWLRFDGVLRPLTILFAFFTYHALFMGLGIFLYRRSQATGKMLLLIAAALVPLMFSIADSVTRLAAEAGAVATLVSLVLAMATLLPIGRRLGIPYFSLVLYLPVPFAIAALSGLALTFPWLTWVMLPALTLSALAATGIQDNKAGMMKVVFASCGGAIALYLLTAMNLPQGDNISRSLRLVAIVVLFAQWSFMLRALDSARARVFTALEIVGYSIVALIPLMVAGLYLGNTGTLRPFRFELLVIPVSIGVFVLAQRQHNAAIHPLIFLTMSLAYCIARILTPDAATHLAVFFAFPLIIPWLSSGFHENKKRIYLYWATTAGIIGSLSILTFQTPNFAAATLGFLTAITIHRAAGFTRSAFHYLSPIGLFVFISRLPLPEAVVLQPYEIWLAVAVIYATGGLYFERRAMPADRKGASPPDDLSLISGFIALLLLSVFIPSVDAWSFDLAGRTLPLRPLLLWLPIYIFLIYRSVRDRSVLILLMANLLSVAFVARWLAPRDYAEGSLILAGFSALFYALAGILAAGTAQQTMQYGRIFLLRLRIPFDFGPGPNAKYAMAITALLLLVLALFSGFNWISSPDFNQRTLQLISQAVLFAITAAVFHFRTFTFMQARGNILVLFALLIVIAQTAIINRLGRPLPVDAVALRLLLLFPVIALATAVFKVYGPRYASYLGNEKHGPWYFAAPVAGVFGLILLLIYEVNSVGVFNFNQSFYLVPPTLYLSLILYPTILSASTHRFFRHLSFLFIPIFLAAVAGSRSFLGFQLTNLNDAALWLPAHFTGKAVDTYGNFTVLLEQGYSLLDYRQNTVAGFALGVLALSIIALTIRRSSTAASISGMAFGKNTTTVHTETGLWSLVFTGLVALLSFNVAALSPGVILMVVAGVYLIAGTIRPSAFIFFLAGLLLVHGGAHVTNTYPVWPGPVLALLACAVIFPVRRLSKLLDLSEQFVSETGFLAGILYVMAAFFYAATEGRSADALNAGMSVLSANVNYLITGGFYRGIALSATLLISTIFLQIALCRIEGRARSALAFLTHTMLLATLTCTTWLALSHFGLAFTFSTSMPYVLPSLLMAELLLTLRLSRWKSTDPDIYAGHFTARDTAIIACGIILMVLALGPVSSLPWAGLMSLTSLVLYLTVNLAAAFTSGKTRYIYIAQATVAGMYFSLRPLLQITSPHVDAFAAFGYAFILLGISVFAERFNVTLVSQPTRRFAAIMPVVIFVVLDDFRSLSTAFYSVVASGLYFMLSRAGERHLFAALAAIALNAALFFVALAQGFDSSEFYAFPIGLTILFFATIFKESLSPINQARVRVIGGLVAYVPAAIHVTLRSGLAEDPTYSVAFGLVCIAGMIAGTLFHIRSYLFLGVLFLTLDIIANLVQEGLQNQFIGFVLLTLTGLVLITVLITFNLRKEQILAKVSDLRAKFANWH